MSTTRAARRDRIRTLNQGIDGADGAEKTRLWRQYMNEVAAERRTRPVPAWLATRRARRTLAASAALTPTLAVAVAVATMLVGEIVAGILGLIMIGVATVTGVLLRRATTLLADASSTNVRSANAASPTRALTCC